MIILAIYRRKSNCSEEKIIENITRYKEPDEALNCAFVTISTFIIFTNIKHGIIVK